MHSCIHCYNLEPYVEAWLEHKPDYINFVRVPTTWDAYRKLHAQAFYTAESLGILDEIMMPFFQAIHGPQDPMETPAKLANLFSRFGVSEDDFNSVFNSFSVMTKVNRADELNKRYRVDSTPTIIINGKYTTSIAMADPVNQNPETMFKVIEALARAELGM
jgi:thiol:disulfide interchange protein DsbA